MFILQQMISTNSIYMLLQALFISRKIDRLLVVKGEGGGGVILNNINE